MSFWIVATPASKPGQAPDIRDEKKERDILTQALRRQADVYPFSLPQHHLKIGTLDSLMALSDDLARLDTQMEACVKLVRKTYNDLFKDKTDEDEKEKARLQSSGKRSEAKAGKRSVTYGPLKVYVQQGVDAKRRRATKQYPPNEYVQNFRWFAERFAEGGKLRDLAAQIAAFRETTEAEVKEKYGAYTDVRNLLSAIERKETGTLLVRPLDPYVEKKDMIQSDLFTTIMVIVPSEREESFLEIYESMEQKYLDKIAQAQKSRRAKQAADANEGQGDSKKEQNEQKEKQNDCLNVVPGSARRLFPRADTASHSEEFVLYRLVVMRKGLDRLRKVCRENRFTVREYEYDADQVEQAKKAKGKLMSKKKNKWSWLVGMLKNNYSEVFQYWIHLKGLRTFVESVLRFGLPVNLCISFIRLSRPSNASSVRAELAKLYNRLDEAQLTGEVDLAPGELAGVAGEDFYPYVYLTLNTDA